MIWRPGDRCRLIYALVIDGVPICSAEIGRTSKMNIYVGNLSYSLDDDELRAAFAAFGEVSSATIIMDKMTGRSKGFGFVEMPVKEEAEAAIKALDGSDLKGRNVRVNEARPREDRPTQRRPRY